MFVSAILNSNRHLPGNRQPVVRSKRDQVAVETERNDDPVRWRVRPARLRIVRERPPFGEVPVGFSQSGSYTSTRRSRNAFAMTDSELRVMAALAQMGLMRRPKTG